MSPEAAKVFAQVVLPEAFTQLPGPPNAPFVRNQAYDDGHVWVGVVTTQPGAASPWHHHGDFDTFAYLLEGSATAEFADDDRETVTVSTPGSFLFVPKNVVHREMNTGETSNKILIMRVGHGQQVFPVEPPKAQ